MKAIFKREFKAYFTSPIGYIFTGVFMLLSGIFYGVYMFVNSVGSVQYILPSCMMIMIFLIPLITMRLLAEERANKTDQLLLTSPVKVHSIVLGKYFAAEAVMLIAMATTLLYLIVAAIWGEVSVGETVATYLGFALMGSLLVAIGLFISSLTDSQILAAVITYGVTLAMFFVGAISTGSDIVNELLNYVNVSYWCNSFYRGVISPTGLVYYLSLIALFLLFTVRKVESRRWR
jgi:ABC-2 type transport system permease protein